MTPPQLERLYRKAYEKCSMQLFGNTYSPIDWHTLYVLSPSWHKTLKTLSNQIDEYILRA